MSEKIRWAIRYGKEDRWFVDPGPGLEPVWTRAKKMRRLFDDRQAVYFECSQLAAGANMAPRVVKVRIVRKPKAKPVSREVWDGTSQSQIGPIAGMGMRLLRADGLQLTGHGINSWLGQHDGKRVRVTLDVLP